MKRQVVLVLILLLGVMTTACYPADSTAQDAETSAPGEPTIRRTAVEVAEVETGSISQVFSYSGNLAAKKTVDVVPRVAGEVEQLNVEIGDEVKAGEIIVEIDDELYLLDLKQAESALSAAQLELEKMEAGARPEEINAAQSALNISARALDDAVNIDSNERTTAAANMAKAEADLNRLSDLLAHDAVAKKEVLAAETAVALSKASVEQATSARESASHRLQLLGLKPGKFDQAVTVGAPLSGKVLELNVVEGEFRNEINAPLMTIADLSRVWATSEVPESQIRFCQVGGIAALDLIAYPGEQFRARVTRIADTVNSETRTVKVTAELDNHDGRLRPDMFGKLRSAGGTVAIPWTTEASVFRMRDGDFVFVEQAKGRFRAVPVQLGKKYDGGYSVTSGLSAGDRVVSRGAIYLKAAL